ncbi:hypothetical protein B0H19DRAFT_1094643 [Mycena capillaripes]|nr:hypothetical protein B0H19DRAFT_1094643 [Mycena capillaripes]
MPIVPTEVAEYIIDFLDGVDDRDTLLSCSLVSRSWVQSSQSHLFHNICLRFRIFWQLKYPGVTGILSHRLDKILVDSPHLAHYIRTLEVVNDNLSLAPSWVSSEPSLPRLLSKLSTLRSLRLTQLNWEVLPEDRQQCLQALLTRPSLTSVHLSICRFPTFMHPLSQAHSLKRLSLNRTYAYPEDDVALNPDDRQALREPVTLNYLALQRVDFLPGFLTSSGVSRWLDITRLRTLVLHDDTSYRCVAPVLSALAKAGTLERLELSSIPESIDLLDRVPSIRHLSIAHIMMSVGHESSAACLVHFLSNIVHALSQLEDIHIEVEAQSTWPECIDWNVWAELDHLLSHLRLITIDVCLYWNDSIVPCTPDTPVVGEITRLRVALPKLMKSGVLQVNLIPALTS